MSINLSSPIELFFDELEVDEYLPSIKFKIKINMQQFAHSLVYCGDFWIDSKVWDFFSENLKSDQQAILKDMSDSFCIKIIKHDELIEFMCLIERKDIFGNIISASYISKIDDDIYSVIKSEFINYPKWW